MRRASPSLVHVSLVATVSATEGVVEERDLGPGTVRCMTVHNPRNPNEHVSLFFGYDFQPETGHLRGYAAMRASFIGTHVEVDSIIADDRDQILQASSGTSPFGLLAIETNPVICQPQGVYRNEAIFAIRWRDELPGYASPPPRIIEPTIDRPSRA